MIILLRGLPASGKTTYARKFIKEHPNTYKRINRDLLREMFDGSEYSAANETFIKEAEIHLAGLCMHEGFLPIIDDTNMSASAMALWENFAQQRACILQIVSFLHVPIETCIARDEARLVGKVGEGVIRIMYARYLKEEEHNETTLTH